MKKKDVVAPFRPEKVAVFIVAHNEGATEAEMIANADAEFEKRLLVLDTSWAADNGGIYETTTTTGIASVAQGDGVTKHPAVSGYTEVSTDVVITMARAWEDADPYTAGRKIIPTVQYLGEEVPIEKIKHIGDGYTSGDFVIIVDNTGLVYGAAAPTASAWSVSLVGQLSGVVSMKPSTVSLPVDEASISFLGNAEAAVKRRTRTGETMEGSITIAEQYERIRVASGAGTGATAPAEVLNAPGEDVESQIFSSWSKGNKNKLTYLASGKVVSILTALFADEAVVADGSGIHLQGDGAAGAGKAFVKLFWDYGCELTEISGANNLEGGSTSAVDRQWSFKPKYAYQQTKLTIA